MDDLELRAKALEFAKGSVSEAEECYQWMKQGFDTTIPSVDEIKKHLTGIISYLQGALLEGNRYEGYCKIVLSKAEKLYQYVDGSPDATSNEAPDLPDDAREAIRMLVEQIEEWRDYEPEAYDSFDETAVARGKEVLARYPE